MNVPALLKLVENPSVPDRWQLLWHFGRMGGERAFQALVKLMRQSGDPAVREIPAAALTAYARAEDRMKALKAGFAAHVSKPVEPDELIGLIAQIAQAGASRDSPALSLVREESL